jgi:hypothetical protein
VGDKHNKSKLSLFKFFLDFPDATGDGDEPTERSISTQIYFVSTSGYKAPTK